MSQGVKITPQQKLDIFFGLRRNLTVREALAEANVGASAAYALLRSDPDFREQWEHARGPVIDMVEDITIDWAIHGELEPVVSAGKLIYHNDEHGRPDFTRPWLVRRRNAAINALVLRAGKPEKYARPENSQQALPLDLQPDPVPTPDEPGPDKPIL